MTDHTPQDGVVVRMRPEDVTTLWIYGGVSAALVAAFVVLENVTLPYGNAQLHTITEVIATLFALIVGVVALVRYYTGRNNRILLIGVGFLGTALLTVYVGVLVLTLVSFCVFAIVPLGRAYFPELPFGRPGEFIAAAVFLAALVDMYTAWEGERSPEQREYLGMVKTSADHLLTVINDILDFSKIEAGKLDLERIDFNLSNNLDDTLATLALRAHKKGLELIDDVRVDVPDNLLGDPGRLRQIIVNLVGNAIKFTERGGEIVVRVQRESQTDAEVCLHFAVADTGIGIPDEKKHRLFQAFSQVDASTTRKYGGTGLGLAAIRNTIQERDPAALRRAAHTLKGSLGNFGDSPPIATAQALETMGHENNLVGAEATYQQLAQEMARLEPALAALVNADP